MKEIRKVNESLGDPVGEFVSPKQHSLERMKATMKEIMCCQGSGSYRYVLNISYDISVSSLGSC